MRKGTLVNVRIGSLVCLVSNSLQYSRRIAGVARKQLFFQEFSRALERNHKIPRVVRTFIKAIFDLEKGHVEYKEVSQIFLILLYKIIVVFPKVNLTVHNQICLINPLLTRSFSNDANFSILVCLTANDYIRKREIHLSL